MKAEKILDFIQEIGTIMYVGGILSHIVIGAVIGHPDPQTALTVAIYKEMSAYILILPGLGLKFLVDIIMFVQYEIKPNWLKIKLLAMTFLAFNAFVFMMPLMPEMQQLARDAMESGQLSQAFLDTVATEAIVGQSNVLPLLIELWVGAFRPKLGKERLVS